MGIECLKCYFEHLTDILYWGKYPPLLPNIKIIPYLTKRFPRQQNTLYRGISALKYMLY